MPAKKTKKAKRSDSPKNWSRARLVVGVEMYYAFLSKVVLAIYPDCDKERIAPDMGDAALRRLLDDRERVRLLEKDLADTRDEWRTQAMDTTRRLDVMLRCTRSGREKRMFPSMPNRDELLNEVDYELKLALKTVRALQEALANKE